MMQGVLSESNKTVSSFAYDQIKNDIIFGRLRPGLKLKLELMKNNYSVSVSILRETLRRLAAEGFVAAHDQRGFFVTPVSRQDLIEVADLRILLECNALEASIKSGDADWEGRVVAANHKLQKAERLMLAGDLSERERWKRSDWEFHAALISSCSSTNLQQIHSVIYDKYLRYQMLVLTFRGEMAVDEHKQVFEAALDKDIKTATAILADHIQGGLSHTLSAVEWSDGEGLELTAMATNQELRDMMS